MLWRDAGDWERFATVWHDDGWMTATWFQGPAHRFIEVSREGFDKGVNILHALGGWTCDVAGTRAISQVKMNILQRAPLDGVMVDVVCIGRFYDFFEKRDGRWAIVRRQPIYEKDRLDPLDPSATLVLDPERARAIPGRISPPRVSAVEERLHRETGIAGPAGAGSRKGVRGGEGLAGGIGKARRAAVTTKVTKDTKDHKGHEGRQPRRAQSAQRESSSLWSL